jgi:hypothetical protein
MDRDHNGARNILLRFLALNHGNQLGDRGAAEDEDKAGSTNEGKACKGGADGTGESADSNPGAAPVEASTGSAGGGNTSEASPSGSRLKSHKEAEDDVICS